jgi:trehalose 2-sulfotransferase
MWKKFPRLSELDRDRFASDMARPLPAKQYVMYFTPRSGSSWITDIAGKTRRLGFPGEVFNPNFLPKITQSFNATTMDEYCEILKRRRNTQDVFGFQITYHQLAAVFRNEADFLKRFPSPTCFWLIRRDIVAQAVSLYKMVQTEVGHAPQMEADEIRAREQSFSYDGSAIRHWLQHILNAEIKTETMFARHGLTPLRMSYERNIELHPNHLVNVIGKHVGIAHMRMKPLQSGHSKIATALNDAFAAEFRSDYSGFVQEVADQRQEMLSRIDVYGPQPAARRRRPRKSDAAQAAPPL